VRSLLERLTRALVGRRGKYLVLAIWVVILAAAWGLAGNLTGAEKNDASAYLPGSAESTKALNRSGLFQSPNTFVAVVVFQRQPVLTSADRTKPGCTA